MISYHDRIKDEKFRVALAMVDAGEVEKLEKFLLQNPAIINQRIDFEETGYFSNPGLLEFTAENPIRHGKLPGNIIEIVKVILEAGAKENPAQISYTLGLVSSGNVARECGVQVPLIDLLCEYGANPDQAMLSALAHAEFDAVEALLKNGAKVNLAVAAATNKMGDFEKLLPESNPLERHQAVALAAQHGRFEILEILLEKGERPDRFNPAGVHSHSTPLHQAVLTGNLEIVKLLVGAGARLDLKDKIYQGTPLDWAVYAKLDDIENYLRLEENI
ncbi:ankyrin repeat domain-containing protein [Dyadobacter subterraneus]|uniref:Ankyrin repeat domain-containing protein n=1 Tax=Dyadobacter subterraneus TaxID=2773304 RepID=A0ABR9WJ91_9BACT|nr:ankyrin repeat domain-containing protein [Dyadobacter subterraneus]MBE9464224.1 ankyrin repeat domain-containing protein [Dyadobacter subterraneus]